MADLHRVVAALALLASFAMPAAAFPPSGGTTTWGWSVNSCNGPSTPSYTYTGTADSGPAACAAGAAQSIAGGNTCIANWTPFSLTGTNYNAGTNTCTTSYTDSGTPKTHTAVGISPPAATCPANSTLTDGQCTCAAPYVENATHDGCVSADTSYCQSIGGSYGGPRVFKASGPGSGTVSICLGPLGPLSDGSYVNCAATGQVSMSAQYPEGWYVWTGDTTYTGGSCEEPTGEGGPAPKDTDAPVCNDPAMCPPPEGKCPGTFNGVAIWVPCTNSTSTDKGTTTQSGTNTDGTSGQRKDERTTTTTCTGSQCTTTTTTINCKPDGTDCKPPTETSSTGSKAGYCAEHASDPQCDGEGNAWGGSCAAGFTCDGDAALCAAAKGVWQQKCALVDGPGTPTSEQQAYAAAKAASGTGIAETTIGISSASFNQSNALGVSARCISNVTVTVMGQTVVLPLSNICPYLAQLGMLNMAVSFLIALIIVFRRAG